MAGSMVYRNKVAEHNRPHMVKFRKAMKAIQARLDNHSFNHIAGFHGAPGFWCWHHQTFRGIKTTTRLFLPWHRAYLLALEQELQDNVADAALPWWDWTSDRGIPDSYDVKEIENEPNPLYNYHIQVLHTIRNPAIDKVTIRFPGRHPFGRLPAKQEILNLLNYSDWASFSDKLQDYHDGVHVWVGGDMFDPITAGFDPIFYAHHCMIDRIWYLWQLKWGNSGIPETILDLPLQPFAQKVRQVLDVQSLGYEYALDTTEIDIGGNGQ